MGLNTARWYDCCARTYFVDIRPYRRPSRGAERYVPQTVRYHAAPRSVGLVALVLVLHVGGLQGIDIY